MVPLPDVVRLPPVPMVNATALVPVVIELNAVPPAVESVTVAELLRYFKTWLVVSYHMSPSVVVEGSVAPPVNCSGPREAELLDGNAIPLPVPVMDTFPPTVKPVSVPTLVKDEPVMLDASNVPVRVPPAADTVIFPVPSKLTPLMVCAVCNAV